jgi:single-strand DNA-binding protein
MKKLQIIGGITKDAELKQTKNLKNYLLFDVAVSENFKNASGEWEKKTEYVKCTIYGDKLDPTRFTKGTRLFCEGKKFETSIYNDKVYLFLTVDNYEIVSKATPSATAQQPAVNQTTKADDFDSELGF